MTIRALYTSGMTQRADYTIPHTAGIALCELTRTFSFIMKSAVPGKIINRLGVHIYTLFRESLARRFVESNRCTMGCYVEFNSIRLH